MMLKTIVTKIYQDAKRPCDRPWGEAGLAWEVPAQQAQGDEHEDDLDDGDGTGLAC